MGASACVRAVFVAACVRAGPFPGLVAPAHSLHFSRSVSVRGLLEARAVRRRLGITVLVPERPGFLQGWGEWGDTVSLPVWLTVKHPVANRVGTLKIWAPPSSLLSSVVCLLTPCPFWASEPSCGQLLPFLWLFLGVPGTISCTLSYPIHLTPFLFLPVEEK